MKEERSSGEDNRGQTDRQIESEYECFWESEVKAEKPAEGPGGVYELSVGCETGGTTC